jgi:hypothetical protein
MKFMVDYLIRSDQNGARVDEAAGVDAIAITDHPAPSKK